ncbi:MAG: Tau-tubulin kinase 1 [Marteilia pararefringens]
MKMCITPFHNSGILREAKIYMKMRKYWGRYTPHFYNLGKIGGFRYIVISEININLKNYAEKLRKKPERQRRMLQLIIGLTEASRAMHEIGYVHRDIKPSNVLVNVRSNKIPRPLLCDFGLSRRILDNEGQLLPPRKSGTIPFRGTYSYSSIHYLQQNEFRFSDDLVSIIYTISSVASIKIFPWYGKESVAETIKLKFDFNVYDHIGEQLSLPVLTAVQVYYDYVNALDYFTKPRYSVLISNLEQLLTDENGGGGGGLGGEVS